MYVMKRSKSQWKRILILDEKIREGTYPNCSSFAKFYEVSSKTIQRDIEFLKDQLGAPIKYDAIKCGYYYKDPFYMLPAIPMSEGELVAIMIGSKALRQYHGTPIAKKLETVLDKLSELLPDPISLNPTELFSNVSFSSPPALSIKPHIWETVLKGLLSKRQIKMTYNGKESRIHPLHLANLQGEWYLFVRFYDYDNFRQIALGRIEKARLLNQPADAVDFDIKKMLKGTVYRFASDGEPFAVTLVFDKEVADSVQEREWHPNQKIRLLKSGKVELKFSAKGDVELKRWILAWGRYCTVKSPKWVKEMIAEEVRVMAKLY